MITKIKLSFVLATLAALLGCESENADCTDCDDTTRPADGVDGQPGPAGQGCVPTDDGTTITLTCGTNVVSWPKGTVGATGATGATGTPGANYDPSLVVRFQALDAAALTQISAECGTRGGRAYRDSYNGVTYAGVAMVSCDGADGQQGIPGRDGTGANPITMASTSIFEGGYCGDATGTSITFYQGGAQLGSTTYVCNGEEGAQGIPGRDGTDGADGQQGIPGRDGTDGSSCSTSETDGICEVSCSDGTSVSWECSDSVQPPLGTPEVCDGIDNDHDDGSEVGGTPDGIDESRGRVYDLILTSSIEPSEPASRRQPCIWGSATDPYDPDSVENWIGCAQPGSWDPAGNTQIDRWQLGDLFPIQLVMQNFDCEAARQGIQAGGTLRINLQTPGDHVTCDYFEIVYLNWDGSPATPICSL